MISRIYFEWYGENEHNDVSFGQITFTDKDDEKLGVVNLDLKYPDLFLFMFEMFKKHGDKYIEMIYEEVIKW